MRVENATQLAQLRVAYAQVQGALQVAQASQQSAEAMARQYLSHLSLILGVDIPPGARVHVDFTTGEVELGADAEQQNGVAV